MLKSRFQFFGTAAIGFGLAAGTVYLLMARITLAHIETVSGQVPLDLRPSGYTFHDVAELFNGLGEDGLRYYLTRQLPLDTLYPALLALTMVCTMCWFGQRLPNSKLVRTGIALSIGTAVFDYCENLGIAVMIISWPNLSETLVRLFSVASIAKSGLTVLALVLLFLIALRWIRQRKADVQQQPPNEN
ncbi:hypothetical protein BC777_3630 [Yoonia maricola]|uniref:Uncharacterized protein n=1 Tax=Yoonia maricola TaxID=420999 RepID=A0A2M8W0Y2_9RHOB|nr:hypothetical protein [Yoonia maricola]PJI84569.1 hypothetical protein BC777_3630 [Yoonia maricola]